MNFLPNEEEVRFILDNFDSYGRCFNPWINRKNKDLIQSLIKKYCVRHQWFDGVPYYYLTGNASNITIQASLSRLLNNNISVISSK